MASSFISIVPVIEQRNVYPFNEWKTINNTHINEIVNITYNELLKKNNEIIINRDLLYEKLVRYLYNTSYNKYKSYKTYS